MNILVTGANGQLGNEMRRVSARSSDHYIFTDVAELDITDLAAIQRITINNQVDVIVNCAAYTNVDKAEEDEATANLINNLAVKYLAIAAKEIDATLIHISTDYVFQGDKNTPCQEEWDTNPLGIYGKTKLAGEQSILESGCRYLIFRTAWLYSEFGNNFVKTVLRLGKERDELGFVFDQIGTPTYAGDLAAAILTVVDSGERDAFVPGIYHFSDEGVCSWYDFTVKILEVAGIECRVRPIETKDYPTKAVRPPYSVLNKKKIKETYGIVIPHWEESLRVCMEKL